MTTTKERPSPGDESPDSGSNRRRRRRSTGGSRGSRRRRRRRRTPPSSSRWLVVAALALAAATVGADVGVAVRTAAPADADAESPGGSSSRSAERKPYRSSTSTSTHGGRLKLVPTRKMLVVTTPEEWERYQRAKSDDETATRPDGGDASRDVDHPAPPDPFSTLVPLLKRGLLLAALTAVAIADRTPPVGAAAALTSGSGSIAVSSSSWSGGRWWFFPFAGVRFDWTKLRSLPGEVLPSLTAALMIAWVPSLVLQRAWFELGFLALSLTSESNLRSYLRTEVLPAMGSTVRKLFWSEFWKRAWDYLLEPFSHNILVPPTYPSSPVGDHPSWTGLRSEVAEFWSGRVVSRIDKWTASSIKALLQKNVQSAVNGMAEDSWKAVAYAWYPDGRTTGASFGRRAELPGSTEDAARMIEIEASCEDGRSDDADCEDDSAEASRGTADDGAEETKSSCDEPRAEDPQPVLT